MGPLRDPLVALKQEVRSLWTAILYNGDTQTFTEHPVILPNSSGADIQSLSLKSPPPSQNTPGAHPHVCVRMCVSKLQDIPVLLEQDCMHYFISEPGASPDGNKTS